MKKTKIQENWKMINDAEKAVQEQTGDPKAGFVGSSFSMEGLYLAIPCIHSHKTVEKGGRKLTTGAKQTLNLTLNPAIV